MNSPTAFTTSVPTTRPLIATPRISQLDPALSIASLIVMFEVLLMCAAFLAWNSCLAFGDEMPPERIPMASAARVLASYPPGPPNRPGIVVMSPDLAKEGDLVDYVRVPGTACTFEKRDFAPQISIGLSRNFRPGEKYADGLVSLIDFSKLTGTWTMTGDGLKFSGRPAFCIAAIVTAEDADRLKHDPKAPMNPQTRWSCYDETPGYGPQGESAAKVIRALQYIRANLCRGIELTPY